MSGNVGVGEDGQFFALDPYLPITHVHEDDDEELLSPCCWAEVNDMWLCCDCLEHIF